MRVCLGTGSGPCPTGELVAKGRCRACSTTTTQRGYGAEHQKARAMLASTLPRYCGYGCGTWITAGSTWHAAHVVDGDPSAGYLVSCVKCNLAARGAFRTLGLERRR